MRVLFASKIYFCFSWILELLYVIQIYTTKGNCSSPVTSQIDTVLRRVMYAFLGPVHVALLVAEAAHPASHTGSRKI